MKKFKNYLFFIFIFVLVNISSGNDDYFIFSSIDLGCLSYTVFPPSGIIIQNLKLFEIQVQFNLKDIRITTLNNLYPIVSLSDTDLLNLVKSNFNQKPIFSIWDKSTNLTYLPTLATSKKTDNTIWLSFSNLPVSNNLYFLNDIGIQSYIYQILGPRSTTVFSSNGVSPPKVEINPFLNSCPTNSKQSSSDFETKWYYNNPSNPKLFSSTIKVESCGLSVSSSICESGQKYYYSILLPVAIGKGTLSLVINSIQYQNFQYKIQDFPITFEIKDDIAVVIPLRNNGYYSPPLEMMLSSSSFQELPFFDLNGISDALFESIYKSPLYDQVYISSVSFNDRSTLFSINPSYTVQNFKDNYTDKRFIFTSKINQSLRVIYIFVSKEKIFEYFNDIIECSPKSNRNSFTVNQGGSSTFHKIGFLNGFNSQEFLLEQIKFNRDLNIKFSNTSINVQQSSSSSSTETLYNQDNSITCQIDFGISSTQYQSLMNSNYLSMASSNLLFDSLMIPKSAFGSGMNQIGVNITDWYKQVGFCNSDHGSGVNNQIQHFKQNGGYTMDIIMPNWQNIAGYSINSGGIENRTIITQDEIKMKLNSNQATFKFQIKSFQFLEPMINQDSLIVNAVPGTIPGLECNGQFQIEVLNFGKQDGLVHFDIDCIQDIYIEVLNYAQTIPTLQKRVFYVNAKIKKYYKGPIECQVSMSLDNKPLWSTLNKSFKKNVTISIFQGCNIPDPCASITGEPSISKVASSYGIQQGSWQSYSNYLNSIEISTMISNIGSEIGDFNSTLSCKVINPVNTNANYFMVNDINYIITLKLAPNKSSLVKFLLYAESSPIENVQLNCSIISSLYKPNTLCWPNSSNQNIQSIIILYPYDKCVKGSDNRLEPTIEYSKLDYSKGIANPSYFSTLSWYQLDTNGMDPSVVPAKYPLQYNSNDPILNSSIRYSQDEVDKVYDTFLLIFVKNGGDATGTFNISLSNCNSTNQIVFTSSGFITSVVAPGNQAGANFRLFSRATNILNYNIGCSLLVEVEIEECFSDIGKRFLQRYFPIYPPYKACAGNWLEPSLYKSLEYWENNAGGSNKFKLPIVKSNWYYYGKYNDSGISKNLYYQDLTLLVENAEYGEGFVKSNLVCSSLTSSSQLLVIKNEKTAQCTLNSKSSCFIKYKIISSPTLSSTLDTDLILCTKTLTLESRVPELSSCWNVAGKSVQDTFNLTKFEDPCSSNQQQQEEVFISTLEKQSIEIKASEWGLQDSENFYFNYNYYQNDQISSTMVYYLIKSIVIENKGYGNGTIQVLTTLSNPNVFLVSNSSTTICTIKSNSYCTFSFLFGYTPFKNYNENNSTSGQEFDYFKNLEIKLNFIVDSKLCWSSINKTLELNIKSSLPSLPCGILGSNNQVSSDISDQVPQVSLIYSKEYTFSNFNYYKLDSNPLNLVFSEWLKINNHSSFSNNSSSISNNSSDIYQIKLMGYIYNMGDSGGMVTFKVECSNQFKESSSIIIDNNGEIVTFIESGSYYNFKFLINIKESSVKRSIIKYKSIITCSISSVVNNEKCWNPYGKFVSQDILLPLDYFNQDDISKPNELNLLLYTLLPVGVLIFLILIILIIKYRQLILHTLNEWKINRYQNQLIKPKSAELEIIKPLSLLVSNIVKIEPNEQKSAASKQVETATLVEPCGCGQLNPEFHCSKCKKSIQNYCNSNLCKNLIHSSTLENLIHQHEQSPTQLIIYNDPRFTLNPNSFIKFNSNNNNVEDLILKKLNKL